MIARRQADSIQVKVALIGAVAVILGASITAIAQVAGDEATQPPTAPPTPTSTSVAPPQSSPPAPVTETPTTEPTTPNVNENATRATLTFVDLGGGVSTINVYPGVNETDTVRNGVYRDGQTVPALCGRSGRTVTSDPTAGEEARSSDLWILITPTNDEPRYAPFTYARLSVDPDDLPDC